MTYMGKSPLKKVDTCRTDSFCYIAETNTTLQINYTPVKMFFKA